VPSPTDWPPLLATLLVGFYWARVLKLVRKTRRRTGQSANFLPPEPLGRALRVLWYPTVAAWIALPLIGVMVDSLPEFLRLRRPPAWVAWSGVLVMSLALAATMVCWKRMGRSWRMGINPGETTQLIVTGPYAYVRHPIYALSTVLMLATLAAAPSIAMAVAAAIHLAFLQWEARREEQYLLRTHGATYGDYCRRVGRFVPRSLKPHRNASGLAD
jgi:protein-S-isoprenylcysteine O-methyltransferase Ste14